MLKRLKLDVLLSIGSTLIILIGLQSCAKYQYSSTDTTGENTGLNSDNPSDDDSTNETNSTPDSGNKNPPLVSNPPLSNSNPPSSVNNPSSTNNPPPPAGNPPVANNPPPPAVSPPPPPLIPPTTQPPVVINPPPASPPPPVPGQAPPPVAPCDGVSCGLNPLTTKPAVTTILLTLGDQSNSQLVINGASSQLIAETVVRSTSPVKNPKILVVLDSGHQGEDLEDTIYIMDVLLARYNADMITTASSGLTLDQIKNYDVVWFNNPGYPMSSKKTLESLLAFKGGVILQGDDLSRGNQNGADFSLTPLTGLKYVDNGTSVTCGGQAYAHDNNRGNQYRVSIDPKKILGANSSVLNFHYGNDIDNSTAASPDLEIIATALGGPASCTQTRPVIVRYFKK